MIHVNRIGFVLNSRPYVAGSVGRYRRMYVHTAPDGARSLQKKRVAFDEMKSMITNCRVLCKPVTLEVRPNPPNRYGNGTLWTLLCRPKRL